MSRRRDILIARACRVILRDRRYSSPRAAALIRWLKSDFEPTADIAGRALAKLGPRAFADLFKYVQAESGLACSRLIWAMELFPEQHERLLPFLREWLSQTEDDVRIQCALSMAHVLTNRLVKNRPIDPSDVAHVRSVLVPAINRGAIRVHLRDLDCALAQAE